MKKLIWVSLSIFLFLSGISYANAQVLLDPKEASNGKVNVNLTFDTGFSGGIELKTKVSGDVEVSDFTWNLALRNFEKRYSFDKNTGILTLYVLTGSNTKNLLDVNGAITLGTIVLKDEKTDKEYSMKLESLSYVNANYNAVIDKELETTQNAFVLKKQTSSSSNTNSNTNTNTNTNVNTNTNTNSNSSTNSNTNTSVNTNTNSSSNSNATSNDNTSSNSSTNSNSNSGSNSNSLSNSNSSTNIGNSGSNSASNTTSNTKGKETKEEKSTFPFIYIIIAIGVLVVIGIIASIVQRKKRA